jgi:hypothetical protein
MLKFPILSLKTGGGIVVAGVAALACASIFRLAPAPDFSAAPDPALQQALAELKAATPEKVVALESALKAARGSLPSAAAFDAWTQGWLQNWSVESRSEETLDGIEVRHYLVSFNRPALRAWPEILANVQSICAEPGLTIDHLDLEVAPEADRFAQAQVAFTIRLKP